MSDWNRCLSLFQNAKLRDTQVVYFGKPSKVLREHGMSSKRMGVVVGRLKKIMRDHPEIDLAVLRNLREPLDAPQLILQSSTEPNSVIVVPVVLQSGRVLLVPIHKDFELNNGEVINMIASIYVKDDANWLNRERSENRVVYEKEGGPA